MNTGRRGFLKGLGALLAGLTVQGRLRAQDAKLASNYVRKYRQTSIPPKPTTLTGWGGIATSGSFVMTGMLPASCCVSGYYGAMCHED